MSTIPLADQIDCVKREIAMRERVYPKWVQARRLSQEQMDRELGRMRAVLATLQGVKEAINKTVSTASQLSGPGISGPIGRRPQ